MLAVFYSFFIIALCRDYVNSFLKFFLLVNFHSKVRLFPTPAVELISVNLFCVKVNPATKNTDKYQYIKLCGFIQAQSIIKIFNMFIVTK